MNHVTVMNTPGRSAADILINGDPVSTYSDLTVLAKQDFGTFAFRLFPALDNELADDYELEAHLTVFQINVLKSLLPKSSFCRALIPSPLNVRKAEADLSAMIGICERNHVECEAPSPVGVYSEIELQYKTALYNAVPADAAKADVCIVKGAPAAGNGQTFAAGNAYALPEEYGGRVIVFPLTDAPLLFDFLKFSRTLMPTANRLREKLTAVKLSAADQAELGVLTGGSPAFCIEGVPSEMAVGAAVTISFRSFPAGEFFIRSTRPDVVGVNAQEIRAYDEGAAVIEIADKNGEVRQSFSVQTVRHTYLTEIRLLPKFPYLTVNEKGKIDVIFIPNNAEDINGVRWESADPSVLQVTPNGEVIALAPGVAAVTVSGKTASCTIEIIVAERLRAITLSETNLKLKPGTKQNVSYSVEPAGAPTDGIVWSFDNPSIASCGSGKDSRTCTLSASMQMEGKGNLRCTDKNTGVSAVCPVQVTSGVGKWDILGILLIIAGCVIPFAQIVPLALGVFGLYRIKIKQPLITAKMCAAAIIAGIIACIFWIAIASN